MNNLADVNLLGVRVIGDHFEKQMETGWLGNSSNIAAVAFEHGSLAAATHAMSNPPNYNAQSKIREQQRAIQQGKLATMINVGGKVVNVCNYSCATAADKQKSNNKLYLMAEQQTKWQPEG